jgi:hypothetical protein
MTWKKASDFMRELAANQEYQDGLARQRAQRRKDWLTKDAEEAPIIAALKKLGVRVRVISELSVIETRLPQAVVDLLFLELDEPRMTAIREAIVYGIGNACSDVDCFDRLVSAYLQEKDPAVQEAFAYTVCLFLDEQRLPHLERLFATRELGDSRLLLLQKVKERFPNFDSPSMR